MSSSLVWHSVWLSDILFCGPAAKTYVKFIYIYIYIYIYIVIYTAYLYIHSNIGRMSQYTKLHMNWYTYVYTYIEWDISDRCHISITLPLLLIFSWALALSFSLWLCCARRGPGMAHRIICTREGKGGPGGTVPDIFNLQNCYWPPQENRQGNIVAV